MQILKRNNGNVDSSVDFHTRVISKHSLPYSENILHIRRLLMSEYTEQKIRFRLNMLVVFVVLAACCLYDVILEYLATSTLKLVLCIITVVLLCACFLLYKAIVVFIPDAIIYRRHRYMKTRETPKPVIPLTSDEFQVLQFIYTQKIPYIVRKDVENLLQYKPSKCKMIIRSLVEQEYLSKVGVGCYIKYLVNADKVNNKVNNVQTNDN